MVRCYKLNKICCLNLSQACIVFGLVELVFGVFFTVERIIALQENNSTEQIVSLVSAIIGICSCFSMIIGSILKNRWLLLPHIVFESLAIGVISLGGLIIVGILLTNVLIVYALLTMAIFSLFTIILIFWWNILVSRFLEIQKEQFTLSDDVEMQ